MPHDGVERRSRRESRSRRSRGRWAGAVCGNTRSRRPLGLLRPARCYGGAWCKPGARSQRCSGRRCPAARDPQTKPRSSGCGHFSAHRATGLQPIGWWIDHSGQRTEVGHSRGRRLFAARLRRPGNDPARCIRLVPHVRPVGASFPCAAPVAIASIASPLSRRI